MQYLSGDDESWYSWIVCGNVFILDKCVMWNLQELLSPMQYLSSDDESWYSWIVRGTNLLWRYIYTYLGASRVLNLYDVGYI